MSKGARSTAGISEKCNSAEGLKDGYGWMPKLFMNKSDRQGEDGEDQGKNQPRKRQGGIDGDENGKGKGKRGLEAGSPKERLLSGSFLGTSTPTIAAKATLPQINTSIKVNPMEATRSPNQEIEEEKSVPEGDAFSQTEQDIYMMHAEIRLLKERVEELLTLRQADNLEILRLNQVLLDATKPAARPESLGEYGGSIEQLLAQAVQSSIADRTRVQDLETENESLKIQINDYNSLVGEVQENLQAASIKYEAEQASANARVEAFARSGITEKRKLQSELDSNRKVLTHLKLTLSETQREVEELRSQTGAKEKSRETASEKMLENLESQLANEKRANRDLQATINSLREELDSTVTKLGESQSLVSKHREESANLHVVIDKEREMNFAILNRREETLRQAQNQLLELEKDSGTVQQDLRAELKRVQEESAAHREEADLQRANLSALHQETGSKLVAAEAKNRELEGQLAEIIENTKRNLREQDEKWEQLMAQAKQRETAARSAAKEAKDFQQDAENEMRRIHTLLEREQSKAERALASETQLSQQLVTLKERQNVILSEERRMFQQQIARLKADASDGIEKQKELNRSDLKKLENAAIDFQREVVLLNLQLASSNKEIARLQEHASQKEQHEKELLRKMEQRMEALQAELAAERTLVDEEKVKVKQDFQVQQTRSRQISEQLGRIVKAKDAISADLTCTTCFDVFDSPVLVLPSEMRCCKKCLSDSLKRDPNTVIVADSILESVSSKLAVLDQMLGQAQRVLSSNPAMKS